jgi:hypothetical protein
MVLSSVVILFIGPALTTRGPGRLMMIGLLFAVLLLTMRMTAAPAPPPRVFLEHHAPQPGD